jgi:hypothetical protein
MLSWGISCAFIGSCFRTSYVHSKKGQAGYALLTDSLKTRSSPVQIKRLCLSPGTGHRIDHGLIVTISTQGMNEMENHRHGSGESNSRTFWAGILSVNHSTWDEDPVLYVLEYFHSEAVYFPGRLYFPCQKSSISLPNREDMAVQDLRTACSGGAGPVESILGGLDPQGLLE